MTKFLNHLKNNGLGSSFAKKCGSQEENAYKIEQLMQMLQTNSILTVDDYIFKARHLTSLYDITKSGQVRFKRKFAKIIIDDLKAQDFLEAANGYWLSGNPSDLTSP